MITLDIHVIIWRALKPEFISKKAANVIHQADAIIFCEISLWEIAMLMKKNRLNLDVSYLEFINLIKASENYIFKGLSLEAAVLAAKLPMGISQDPADRMICATSRFNNAPLVTADKNLIKSRNVKTIW